MGRSRYTFTETDKPHFLTCTIMEWLPLFIRPYIVDHLLNCWRYQQTHHDLKLYGFVILENHLHFVAQAPDLSKCLSQFKSFTARQIIDDLQSKGADKALQRLRFSKRAHKQDRVYQLWQEGSHAEMVYSESVMRQKLEYIHNNPVKRGYVDLPEQWRYSSARNYAGMPGLIEVQCWYGNGTQSVPGCIPTRSVGTISAVESDLIVPTLCVGMQPGTLCVPFQYQH